MELDFDNEEDWLQKEPLEKTPIFDKIEFGKGCKGYCQNNEKNKACGRLDISCKNLGGNNCGKDYKKHYEQEIMKGKVFNAMHNVKHEEGIY